jgi:Immunoglobulin domain
MKAIYILGILSACLILRAQTLSQSAINSALSSAPPPMTAAVAQTNLLANPVVWQQFQLAAAQAAAAAYLAESTSNQQTLPSPGLSGPSSNLTGQATLPVSGQITIEGTEAVGRGGPHTVEFAANLNTMAAVNVMMADGEQLQSHLLGLSYNTADGQGVMIAGMKDSVGELLPPNRIIYRNAFDGGIDGDVIYTYTAYSIEQDIVLRQQLPSPAQYQLDPAQARLGVITEFIQPPEPLQAPASVDLSALNKQEGVQGPLTLPDEQIQFKTMRIVQGRAFSLGDSSTIIPSGKRWLQIAGRHFLIESTPYPLIEPLLNTLPSLTAQVTTHKAGSFGAMLLSPPKASLAKKHQQIQLSRSGVTAPGVVLDYLMVSTPMLDINFGAADTNKVGFAYIGQTTNDYWNGYQFWGQTNATIYDLKWVDRNYSGINLNVQNAPGVWANDTGDGMYDPFIYPWIGSNVTTTISDVPAGNYDFYLYGHSGNAWENSKFQITVGTNITAWEQTQDSTYAATSTDWTIGVQFVLFTNITISSGQSVVITCAPGDRGSAIFNGLQIVSDVTGYPVILAQPESQCVFLGGNATLAVTVSGTTPLSYQWQFNGTNISGATASTLSLDDVQFADGGSYTVVVSNLLGSVTSAPAVLTVLSSYSALLNVNFTDSRTRTGWAAIGLTTNDVWNEYLEQGGNSGAVTMTNLQWSDGVTSSLLAINMTVSNAPGIWANNTGDNMYDPFIYPWNGGDVFVTLTNLPTDTYDFYLYGHSGNAWENSKFQITVGTNTTAWEQTQDSTFAATSTKWVEGVQYVVFRGVAVTNNQPVTIICARGDGGNAIFNGLQILLPTPSGQADPGGSGLPDGWEIANFGHLLVDPNADPDSDGLNNLQEYLYGTNPNASQGFGIWLSTPTVTSGIP